MECYIPAFIDAKVPFIPEEIVVLTGGALSETFYETTACITACVSVERCLCGVFPLQVKRIITHKRTICLLILVFVINIVPICGFYFIVYHVYLKFDAERNRILLRIRHKNMPAVDDLIFVYRSLILNIAPLVVMSVSSICLAVQMRRIAIRRSNAADNSNAFSDRAQRRYSLSMRVSKTILLIAGTSCVIGLLYASKSLTVIVIPEFKPMGALGDEFRFVSRILFFLSEINGSGSVFIHYSVGSKFKRTFQKLLKKGVCT